MPGNRGKKKKVMLNRGGGKLKLKWGGVGSRGCGKATKGRGYNK